MSLDRDSVLVAAQDAMICAEKCAKSYFLFRKSIILSDATYEKGYNWPDSAVIGDF